MMMTPRWIIAATLLLAAAAETAYAQRERFFDFEPRLPRPAAAVDQDEGTFHFCRLRFRTSPYGDGNGWWVDYPRADTNLSLRLAETTRIPVARQANGDPSHAVVTATAAALMQ